MRPTAVIVFLCVVASACGQSLIGGSIAPDGRYPYMVGLRRGNRFMCGASIINERWLLTAAHCVTPIRRKEDVTAIVGTNLWNGDGNGTVYNINKIIQHKDYNKNFVHSDDIALFQVVGKITFTKKVQPIKLPKDNSKSYVGATAILSGWGKLTEKEQPPSQLQHAKLKVITHANCSKQWKTSRNREIRLTQLCTSGWAEENLATSGDSGGPLVSDGVQIGLVSFAWNKLPDVFTRVSTYLPWIQKQIAA